MIANQVKGTGFRGALNYLLGKEESIIIGGNMVGENPNELAKEFSVSRALRPNLKRVVYHASLSLPHEEHLSTSKWNEVADSYVNKMGFKGSQYLVVKHNDTEHSHIHILASRIRLDGSVVSDSQDYKRSEKIVRGLEKTHNLSRTVSSREVGKSAPTKGELHKILRENKPSTKMWLQGIINEVTQDRPDANIFAKRLAKHGVEIIPNKSKTGHISGISFEINGERMKGSDLGRNYSWKNLTEGKLNYGLSNKDSKNITSKSNVNERQKYERGHDSSSARGNHQRVLPVTGGTTQRRNSPSYDRVYSGQSKVFGRLAPKQESNLFRTLLTSESTQSGEQNDRESHKDSHKTGQGGSRKYKAKKQRSSNLEYSSYMSGKRNSYGGNELSLPEKHLHAALSTLESEKKEKLEREKTKIIFKRKDKTKSRSKDQGRYFDLDIGL